jgi:hypothetical protein
MKNQISYTYSVLRYVHDVTSGEFVNVGVALYAPQARYLSAICRTTYGRLNKVFPGVNAEHFKALMRHIQNSFEAQGERLAGELPFAAPLACWRLPSRCYRKTIVPCNGRRLGAVVPTTRRRPWKSFSIAW